MNSALQLVSDLARIPLDQRATVSAWARALESLPRPYQEHYPRLAEQFGVSVATARRNHDMFRAGGVTALVNHSKTPNRSSALTADFIEYWQALAEKYQRKSKPAYRALLRAWAAGEQIPGLPADAPRTEPPPGCSYENLIRKLSQFTLVTSRRGLGIALANLGPKTLNTRVGLHCGSHYMFDDLVHDNFVVYRKQIVRVLELDCLDYFSGCKILWGLKPRYQREDGTFDGLKEKAMRMLVASLLHTRGYSPKGTQLIAEHGTAAISDRIEQILHDTCVHLHGQPLITIRRSGIIGNQQALAHQRGDGKGNPRHKAPLESLRNLIHNELAALPAQTGLSAEARPEQTHGLLVETSDLIKVREQLLRTHPQRAQLLQLPLLDYFTQFEPLISDIYGLINARTDHQLEGWTACGHTEIQYRLAPDTSHWLTQGEYLALPDPSRQMIATIAASDPRFFRQQQLSPAAVWKQGTRDLLRIPDHVVAEMLGPDLAREETCDEFYFSWQDTEISPDDDLRYGTLITDPQGRELLLAPGKYLVWCNPFAPGVLFIHNAAGQYLGKSLRITRTTRGDYEGTMAQWKRNSHHLSQVLAPYKARHTQELRAATQRAAHNTRIADTSRPLTPSEKSTQKTTRIAQDILDQVENPFA